MKENYEHQIKSIKKTWDKQVKKLVTLILAFKYSRFKPLKYLLCNFQTSDISTKERKIKQSDGKVSGVEHIEDNKNDQVS